MATCPNCGSYAIKIVPGDGKDMDTGYIDDDFVTCQNCGESYDFSDIEVEVAI